MADQPLHRLADADLEAALRGLADAIDWPMAGPAAAGGPDLAASVRSRIEAGEAGARPSRPSWRDVWRSWRPVRRVVAVAVVTLLALAVLAALAGAAGIGLPGLRINLGPAPVSPPPSLSPPPSTGNGPSGPPGSGMRLGERVALADLDARAGFPVRWPADPAIGPPDAAYIDDALGGQVTLVWAARPDLPQTLQPGVGLGLSAFRGTVECGFYNKAVSAGTTVQLVMVNGDRSFWLGGAPHFFYYQSPTGQIFDPRRWVGDALLWSEEPITYRLESALGRDRTIELAESLP